jgi:hypothetical protein
MRSLVLLSLVCSQAFAQEGPETPVISSPAVQEIDFEQLAVSAKMAKPHAVSISEVRGLEFNPLIPLRVSFDTEMQESVAEVK